MSAVLAIVGRPNVGKSALFNRIVGRRIAIVHNEPGVTRDRLSVEAEWCGRGFTLVDTGGLGLRRGEQAGDPIVRATLQQVHIAIEAAQVILLVVNVQDGLVPLDREAADQLRGCGKPVVVVANKADNSASDAGAAEFAELGFEPVLPVSAIHGRGIQSLMEAAMASLPPRRAEPHVSGSELSDQQLPSSRPGKHQTGRDEPLKLAVVGRPNVGKSSLINALTRGERVIVSPVPGTTRDAVDVPLEVSTEGRREQYVLIDTAGVRQKRHLQSAVEFFSVRRAEDSIARCDLAVLVVDAEAGILEQDKKIAGAIVAGRKACVVVVNKWDRFEASVAEAGRRRTTPTRAARPHGPPDAAPPTLAAFGRWVQEQLFFLDYAPVIFASAHSGFHLDRLLEAVRYVAAQLQQHVPTALLNRMLHEAIERRQPATAGGRRLKFFYATQVRQRPPTFLLFVNRVELFSDPYARYLAGELRRAFGYEGCPLVLVPKPRPKTIEPIRGTKKGRR